MWNSSEARLHWELPGKGSLPHRTAPTVGLEVLPQTWAGDKLWLVALWAFSSPLSGRSHDPPTPQAPVALPLQKETELLIHCCFPQPIFLSC